MKYILLFITIGLIFGAGFVLKMIKISSKQKKGIVIVLNGPSASGKSSIQKAFQKLMMPNLWIKLGIDNLLDNVMPEITRENLVFWQSPNPIRWVDTTADNDNNPIITLHLGEQGTW